MVKKQILLIALLSIGFNMIAMKSESDEKDLLGEQLIKAAGCNDTEAMKALIKAGADVNYHDNSMGGRTPLIEAAVLGNVEAAKLLIDAKARIDDSNDLRQTALGKAVHQGTPETIGIVKFLIQEGADLYHTGYYGQTALTLTVDYSFESIDTTNVQLILVQILLEAITKLTPYEKDSIKNWLLVEQRLRHKNRGLPKDLKKPIAQNIYRSLANDLRDRVIRAGGLKAVEQAQEMAKMDRVDIFRPVVDLLNQYLDLNFLENLVRQQTMLPKPVEPEESQEEEYGGWPCNVM